MVIGEAKFVTSAADKRGFLKTEKPVIAVCGKSNVGKSSFINMLANRKQLARASAEPGRTRLVNYFDFGQFVLADKTMIDFLYATQTPFTIVTTKADKLSRMRVRESVRRIAACFKTGEGNVIATSAETRQGREEVLSVIEGVCARFASPELPEEEDEE